MKAGSEAREAASRRIATPWGHAALVEEVRVPQAAGAKLFATVVQLLEARDGELLVRFAYTTDGIVRRGPVTLRSDDLTRLRGLLGRAPALAAAVELGGERAG